MLKFRELKEAKVSLNLEDASIGRNVNGRIKMEIIRQTKVRNLRAKRANTVGLVSIAVIASITNTISTDITDIINTEIKKRRKKVILDKKILSHRARRLKLLLCNYVKFRTNHLFISRSPLKLPLEGTTWQIT